MNRRVAVVAACVPELHCLALQVWAARWCLSTCLRLPPSPTAACSTSATSSLSPSASSSPASSTSKSNLGAPPYDTRIGHAMSLVCEEFFQAQNMAPPLPPIYCLRAHYSQRDAVWRVEAVGKRVWLDLRSWPSNQKPGLKLIGYVSCPPAAV